MDKKTQERIKELEAKVEELQTALWNCEGERDKFKEYWQEAGDRARRLANK